MEKGATDEVCARVLAKHLGRCVLVVLPIYLAIVALLKGMQSVAPLVRPFTMLLPDWVPAENLLSLVLVLIVCFDPRRGSATGPILGGRVPSASARVAAGWQTPDCAPVSRVPELSPSHSRRLVIVYSDLCEDLLPPRGAETPVPYGTVQSQSVDARPLACPRCWRRCALSAVLPPAL
jgi:hypothetical protein